MMKKQAKWIWYPGDFEIHHALKLNYRREERGFIWPAFWRLDDCWHNVLVRRKCIFLESEKIKAIGTGMGYLEVNGKKVSFGETVLVEPGEVLLKVACAKTDGLPALRYKRVSSLVTLNGRLAR